MRFTVDHDLHIHTLLSSCSRNPEQTTENILRYAVDNGLKRICITDHYWDSSVPGASPWYEPQNFEHISKSKPLPSAEGVEFLFGCETDLDKFMTLGITGERFCDFDFVIIPTTHLHMKGFTIEEGDMASNEKIAELWVKRLDALLDMPLPFHKIGIAHLACSLMNKRSREDYIATLDLIPSEDMQRIFTKAAGLGSGIEINGEDMKFEEHEQESILRMFKIAKECGCKFYLGTDAHGPGGFKNARETFERAITMLNLKESDKFNIK